jgi:hypothetical protein
MPDYTGSVANGFISVISNNDSSPTFTWQAGKSDNFSVSAEDVYYRATIRPYSDGGRAPNVDVLYEETGITDTTWQFTLDKNLQCVGGPVREYQVVIEAHNAAGKTSAGNQIGVTPDVGWNIYPNGFDIIAVENPRFTGFQFKRFVDTPVTGVDDFRTGVSGCFDNFGYIGPNGDIVIEIISGSLPSDLVGGYIYSSTGLFPVYEATINTGFGGLSVSKSRFDFNPLNPIIYHPTAAKNLVSGKRGYISISFYDEVDEALLLSGVNIATGLYVSNHTVLYNQSVVGELNLTSQVSSGVIGGGITLKNLTWQGDQFPTSYYGYTIVDFNTATVIASGTVDGITSIIYMYPASGINLNW